MSVHTYDSLLSMIYSVDREDRQRSVFTCNPKTMCDLKLIHDGDGRYLTEAPMQNWEPYRVFGYPVVVKADQDELTFGPDSK